MGPLMSHIARVARGTPAHGSHSGRRDHSPVDFLKRELSRPNPVGRLTESLKGNLRSARASIAAEMGGNEARVRLNREREVQQQEEEHQLRLASKKAREVIFTWGEGFEQYESTLPLFNQTYQTLINEGVDFTDVSMVTPAMLEQPSTAVRFSESGSVADSSANVEEAALQHALRVSMTDRKMSAEEAATTSGAGAGAPAIATASTTDALVTSAHESAQLLADVIASRAGGDIVEAVVSDCRDKQRLVATAVDAAIAAGDDDVLMDILSANEALQTALTNAEEGPQDDDSEFGAEEKEKQLHITQGPAEVSGKSENALIPMEDDDEDKENEEKEEKELSLFDLDFNNQGSFAKEVDACTTEAGGVENTKAPGTTPILPDL